MHAASPLVADSLAWVEPERGSFVTFVAKLELTWVNGGACAPKPASAIVSNDRHHDRSPLRSLEAAAELPPYLPHPEVLLIGSAWVPGSVAASALTVQLSLARSDVVFRKHVQVHGDRVHPDEAGLPFRTMPITWERAMRGANNPVGVEPDERQPNIIDPEVLARPAGLAPVSALWPVRRERLGQHPRPRLDVEPLELPAGFDGTYFQAARNDQWLTELVGDEWIGLDGLHPVLPRILTRLPGLHVAARLMDADWRITDELRLSPDRLVLDSNRQHATLFYRVVAPVELSRMSELTVLVGLGEPQGEVQWPNPEDPSTLCTHHAKRAPSLGLDARTLLSHDAPARAASGPIHVEELHDPDEPLGSTMAMRPVRTEQPIDETHPVDETIDVEDPEDEPFNETQALRAILPISEALPFHPDDDGQQHEDERDPAEEDFLSGTMKLKALKQLPKPLPFVEPSHVADEPTVDSSAPARRVRALPFDPPSEPGDQATASVATTKSDAIIDDLPTAEAGAPKKGMFDDEEHTAFQALPAKGPALPFEADPPAKKGAFDDEEHTAFESLPPERPALPFAAPAKKKGLFDDDEHTAFAPLPVRGAALPFGPAGSPPVRRVPAPSVPPAIPSLGAPSERPRAAAPQPSAPETRSASEHPSPHVPPTPPGPERLSETVPWISDAPLAVATIAWRIKPPQDSLTVIAKASFDLMHDAPARVSAHPELPGGDVFADDDPERGLLSASDFAIVKPMVDVLVRGHAYPPRGSATHMLATLRLRGKEALDRSIAVIGDRTWQGRSPSKPEPFASMPITYERAFGGPALRENPVGVGHGRARDATRALPNFELPARPIASPGDSPPPVCFGPIHPHWAARWGLLGTYDAAWFRTRWPYFAEDFDYRYFQSAPPSQRLSALSGNESFELVGLHPHHDRLRGELPGVRARCFAQLTPEAGGDFIELDLRIDTVTFDTDAAMVHVVWRGVRDVRDDEASEIQQLFATLEPLGAPLTADDVRARYLQALSREPAPSEAPTPSEAPAAYAIDEPTSETLAGLETKLDALQASLDADLEASGASTRPATSLGDLAERMRAAGATDEDVAELALALEDPPPPAEIDLRELVEQRIAAGESLAELDLRGADLSYLDLDGQNLCRSDLTGASLDHASFEDANFAEAKLVRANLTSVQANGATLTSADLTDAVMDHAVLTRSVLAGTTLLRAQALHADFSGSTGARAAFHEAKLNHARFDQAELGAADFSRADLDRTSFASAKLAEVRLYDATGCPSFLEADLTGARAEGVKFGGATFTKARADGSVWERAELSGASFRFASLAGASFVKACCEKTIFAGSDLSSARLRKSRMSGAFFSRANLMEASCEKADFSHADFRRANLHGSVFNESSLSEANLDGAILTYSTLERTQP